ncbi:MAG: hypothetical protein SGILL_007063, partial [Bacillariaceae sp.]
EVVGPEYWNEARVYSKKVIQTKTPTTTSASVQQRIEDDDMSYATSDLSFIHDGLSGYASPASSAEESQISQEERIRKKRLWMIICVFMKYLMRNDTELYLRARDLVSDCLHRHRNGDESHRSLSSSIQACLKKEIGTNHWRRAESFVAKILLSKSAQEDSMMMIEPLPLCASSHRKRMDDPNSLKSDKKRQRFFEV